MRRTPRVVIDRRAILISLAAELQTRTLVVDVEPLLSRWHAADGEAVIAATTAFAHESTARIPSLQHLVFATNARMPFLKGRDFGAGVLFITNARKPWRTKYLKGSPAPITVIGDQVLTDGLLAHRLGGSFLHWRSGDAMPPWPRAQAIAGRLIENVFFSVRVVPAGLNTEPRT